MIFRQSTLPTVGAGMPANYRDASFRDRSNSISVCVNDPGERDVMVQAARSWSAGAPRALPCIF